MSIQAIGSVSGFAPVLVIDRSQDPVNGVVRVADAVEVIGEAAVRATSQIPPVESSAAAPVVLKRDMAAVDLQSQMESRLLSALEYLPIDRTISAQEYRARVNRMVIFGSLHIDVLV